MTYNLNSTTIQDAMNILSKNGFDGAGEVFRLIMNEAMKIERSQTLQAQPYERSKTRTGHSNGFKKKTVNSRLGKVTLDIPQVRGDVSFYPKALERGNRSEVALKTAIAEMYLQGVSTRKVSRIMKELCGFEVSSTDVSRATQRLDEQLELWRSRPLDQVPVKYLVLDARYEKVRVNGAVISCAVLIAVGIKANGKRMVLGTSVSLSEAEVHWRTFLESLQSRGLFGVEYIVSDDHKGILAALQARFTSIPWQRCQFHLQQNAIAYVPKVSLRKEVASCMRDIFNAPSLTEAQTRLKAATIKYEMVAPSLSSWMESALPQAHFPHLDRSFFFGIIGRHLCFGSMKTLSVTPSDTRYSCCAGVGFFIICLIPSSVFMT